MIILLFGAPGTGKTTYAKYLAKKTGAVTVSTGELLREMAVSDRQMAATLDAGHLISDELVNQIVDAKLNEIGPNFVLDGYPRALPQVQPFLDFLAKHNWKIDYIFHLQVPVELVVQRMLARGREDDKPEVVRERFTVFEQETKPVIDYFEHSGQKIYEIDNRLSIPESENKFDAIVKNS